MQAGTVSRQGLRVPWEAWTQKAKEGGGDQPQQCQVPPKQEQEEVP
jgi:hypothetical protein